MKYSILCIILSFVIISSCKEQASTKVIENTPIKPANKPAQNKVAEYWKTLQKETGISTNQREKIVAIQKKYKDRIKAFKKNGNWEGESNKKNRLNISSNTQKEIKGILGKALYDKKLAFDKKFNALK